MGIKRGYKYMGSITISTSGGGTNGTVTLSTQSTTKITLGYKPKRVSIIIYKNNSSFSFSSYNEDISTSIQFMGYVNTAGSGCAIRTIPHTSVGSPFITSIDADGFTLNRINSTSVSYYGVTCYWFAQK